MYVRTNIVTHSSPLTLQHWLAALNAQDFYGAGVSARAAARAGVYVAASDNALDALSLNPAGLSALTAPTLDLSASGILARGSFTKFRE